MEETYSINMGMIYFEIASISASLKISLEVQIKDLPKKEREYWRDQHRVKELGILLGILTPSKDQIKSIQGYEMMKQEQEEIIQRLEKYNLERRESK